METARGGTGLPLVTAAEFGRTVEPFGRGGQLEERDLADFHAAVQSNRQARDVAQLEGQAAPPTWVYKAGGTMDEEAEATKAAFAFKPGDDILRQFDVLESTAQHEFPGMEHERITVTDGDFFRKVVQRLPHVDVGLARIGKDQEPTVQVQVDAGWLNVGVVDGLDHDAALVELPADAAVAENHQGHFSP